ncbi:MAG: hypothetical protein ACLFS7_07375 [Desulfosudaceae bacterium]
MSLQVKGTILVDLVKQVRAERSLNWDDYLTPADWDLVDGDVMASSWYPDDFFYRLSLAVFKVIGQSDFEACLAYGRLTAGNMAEIYKNIIVPGEPAITIERFMTRRKSFFSTDYKDSEKNQVIKKKGGVDAYTVVDEKIRGQDVADVIMYSVLGVMHELAVISGERRVTSDLVNLGDHYHLRINWG